MIKLSAYTTDDLLFEELNALCQRSGWTLRRGHWHEGEPQELRECGAHALLVDMRAPDPEQVAMSDALHRDFPCLPLIQVTNPGSNESPDEGQPAVPVDRLDDLEHILLSLMCACGPDELPHAGHDQTVRPRVLIVDDDERLATALSRYLHEYGHCDVRVAQTGFQAGAMLSSFHPHVAVLDLALGDVDGREICAFIRRQAGLADTRIIGVSGYVPAELIAASDDTFDAFLEKPFGVRDLADKIFSLLN
jgi:CheY-like chemotaxis protein